MAQADVAPAKCCRALRPALRLVEMDFDSTGRVLAALEREGVRYVVVGAAAINLLGLPRATQAFRIEDS